MGEEGEVIYLIVKDIMQEEVQKIASSTTVEDAAKTMAEEEVRYLIVTRNSKLAGIVTENDILRKVVAEGREPAKTRIDEIMVKKVIHIGPEKTIEDAAKTMTDEKIKKLPVVEGDKLIGIITAADMIAAEPEMMERMGELFLLAKKPRMVAG